MINQATLVALLLSFAPILDYERPVRQPIPRGEKVAEVIAAASLETDDAIWFAVHLDVIGAHESGYNVSAIGDHEGGVGRSCGAWQTPCARTPGFSRCQQDDGARCRWGWSFHGNPHIALEQARVAIRVLKAAREGCEGHAIWMYASGTCTRTRTAVLYEQDVMSETQASTPALDSL